MDDNFEVPDELPKMLKAYAKVKHLISALYLDSICYALFANRNYLCLYLKSKKISSFFQAAIRTDPEDLLKWTAEYFRCLSENEPVPYKKKVV